LSTDKPILLELFCADVLTRFKKALYVHDALCQAYKERTGLELRPESDYTTEDVRRALRILRANGRPADIP
jgi:hypothetical protein